MNRLVPHLVQKPHSLELALNVLVIYEDVIAGELGCEIARRFADEETEDLNVATWNAELIDEPYFADFISQRAAEADIIVVVIRGIDGLTTSLRNRIKSWSSQKEHKLHGIVMVLEESVRSESACLANFARGIARDAEMDFFRHKDDRFADEDGSPARRELLWII